MINLLIFFAIPFAVIIYSIALQKILKCPYLVAAITFSTFLIITFALSNLNFLIAGIIYTILSFVTAYITMLVNRYLRQRNNDNDNNNNNNNNNNGISRINNNFCGCNRR